MPTFGTAVKMRWLLLVLLIGNVAFAGNRRIYLGGAYDQPQCLLIAGSQGFPKGYFGPGLDDAGNYYPYVNACFGEKNAPITVGPGVVARFDVWVKPGTDPVKCVGDVNFAFPLLRCRLQEGVSTYFQCVSDKTTESVAAIERVPCVFRAYQTTRIR